MFQFHSVRKKKKKEEERIFYILYTQNPRKLLNENFKNQKLVIILNLNE